MSSPGAPLPSVSSVLKWARGQVEPVGQNPASNKRLIAAVDEETLPAPLTNATIQRAIQELPQGACVALESCLTALKSKRLSDSEFLAFARSLTWQSAALAAAFQQNPMTHSGQAAQSVAQPGPENHDAKRQRMNMAGNADITSTAHALMSLNASNNQVTQWGAISQLPSLQHLLSQGRPDASQPALERAPRGPSAQSSSSTPSPLTGALQPMYSPAELAQALASLSQAHQTSQQQQQHHSMKVPPQVKIEGAGKDGSSSSSSPSTPPSRPAQAEKPPAASTNKASAARVVVEGMQKDGGRCGVGVGGGQWQGASGIGEGVASTLSNTDDCSAHNKYCHFCQHIKVKRASSMIACENRGCNRRFCEHCLNTHIADQSYTLQWRRSGIAWHCPICTKTCCCTLRECTKTHRHCKAYRYRRKRAQLAENDGPAQPAADPQSILVGTVTVPPMLPLHMRTPPAQYNAAMFAMLGSHGGHAQAAHAFFQGQQPAASHLPVATTVGLPPHMYF